MRRETAVYDDVAVVVVVVDDDDAATIPFLLHVKIQEVRASEGHETGSWHWHH